jgi:hypothetical protein
MGSRFQDYLKYIHNLLAGKVSEVVRALPWRVDALPDVTTIVGPANMPSCCDEIIYDLSNDLHGTAGPAFENIPVCIKKLIAIVRTNDQIDAIPNILNRSTNVKHVTIRLINYGGVVAVCLPLPRTDLFEALSNQRHLRSLTLVDRFVAEQQFKIVGEFIRRNAHINRITWRYADYVKPQSQHLYALADGLSGQDVDRSEGRPMKALHRAVKSIRSRSFPLDSLFICLGNNFKVNLYDLGCFLEDPCNRIAHLTLYSDLEVDSLPMKFLDSLEGENCLIKSMRFRNYKTIHKKEIQLSFLPQMLSKMKHLHWLDMDETSFNGIYRHRVVLSQVTCFCLRSPQPVTEKTLRRMARMFVNLEYLAVQVVNLADIEIIKGKFPQLKALVTWKEWSEEEKRLHNYESELLETYLYDDAEGFLPVSIFNRGKLTSVRTKVLNSFQVRPLSSTEGNRDIALPVPVDHTNAIGSWLVYLSVNYLMSSLIVLSIFAVFWQLRQKGVTASIFK